jgi:hypothetical protein
MAKIGILVIAPWLLFFEPFADASEIVRVVPREGAMKEARQPRAAIDRDGRIYVVCGAGNTVYFCTSADGGKSFSEPVAVASLGVMSLGMRRGPRVAVTNKAVLIAAIGGPQGMGKDGDLFCWRSTDRGTKWSSPERVNSRVSSAREGLHALAARPDGTAFCAWLDDRNGRKEVFGATSRDDGRTWQADRLIYRSPEKSVCECCHPSAEFTPDGELCLMWRNSIKGNRDMYLSRSSDAGATFSAATRLGQLSWRLDGCPMDGGALASGREGAVQTIWARSGSIFLHAPGGVERRLGPGAQPTAAMGADGIWAAWLQQRPGPLVVLAPGTSEPKVLAKSANDPSLAAAFDGHGPVIAVWDGGPADPGIFFTRLAERREQK